MAQTPALYYSADGVIDYTPGSDVIAGQIVEINGLVMIAPVAIPSGVKGALIYKGICKVPQKAEIFAAGQDVFWDPAGDPVVGTAGTGAATGTAGGLNLMGQAMAITAATDTYVYVLLSAEKRMPPLPAASVAATGSDQSDAAAIATGITWVTAADATKGVKLPAAAAGLVCIVKNDDTANAVLKVWPNTDDTINAIAANTNIAMAAKTSAVFACLDGTAWFTVPLLPS